jgi:hypothetical protein
MRVTASPCAFLSVMPHPAVLLVIWAGFAFALQRAQFPWTLGSAMICLLLALAFARLRSLNLIRRSRWLLFSLGLIFLFLTPGEYLPGFPGKLGLTYEGLLRAGEQLSRLLALLTSLALLHERVGTPGLLTGLYWLLGPFGWREKTVVRLMLVLDYVERQGSGGWRVWLEPQEDKPCDTDNMSLEMAHMRGADIAMITGIMLTFLVWIFLS